MSDIGDLFGWVGRYLADRQWDSAPIRDETAYRLAYEGSVLSWTCLAVVREARQELVFYSVHPRFVDVEQRAQVGEYLGAATWGLALGNFEMERGTGEVRFRTAVGFGGAPPSPQLCDVLIDSNVALMDRYAPGIDLVVAGVPVDEALAAVEVRS